MADQTEVGWRFPPTGDGDAPGYNDGAIDAFKGERLSSLVREIVQNSLDAKKRNFEGPVKVAFNLRSYPSASFPEISSLKENMAAAHAAAVDEGVSKAVSFFEHALVRLNDDNVSLLSIHDGNTTGLTGSLDGRKGPWIALTKRPGLSQKEQPGALGSYGHGSSAPFNMSDVRSLFYYSVIDSENIHEKRFQGKSILQSHMDSDGLTTQASGFYGLKDGCRPLTGDAVPAFASNIRDEAMEGTGTSIYVPHTTYRDDLFPETAITVIGNFYYAIMQGYLEVDVGDGEFSLTKDTVRGHYLDLKEQLEDEQDEIDIKVIKEYFESVETIVNPDEQNEQQLPGFGLIHWYMRFNDDRIIRRRVGIARQNGMMITKRPHGLQQFQNTNPFDMFVCVVGEDGSEFLGSLENPKHDDFETDRIDDEEKRKEAERKYRAFTDKIREIIMRFAKIQAEDEEVLTDIDFLTDLGAGQNANDGFERSEQLTLELGNPIGTRPPPPRVFEPDDNGPELPIPGPEPGPGPGPWPGPGPQPLRRTLIIGRGQAINIPPNTERHMLRNLRMRPEGGDGLSSVLYFDAPVTGAVWLELEKSGEGLKERLKFTVSDGSEADVLMIETEAGTRQELAVNFSESVSEFAVEGVVYVIEE